MIELTKEDYRCLIRLVINRIAEARNKRNEVKDIIDRYKTSPNLNKSQLEMSLGYFDFHIEYLNGLIANLEILRKEASIC